MEGLAGQNHEGQCPYAKNFRFGLLGDEESLKVFKQV